MREARHVDHTPAEKRRGLLSAVTLFAAVGLAFLGIETAGWASEVIGAAALLLCYLGYRLIRLSD